MTTILHIASSSNLHSSVTRQIGAVALADLQKAHPGASIIERDLIKTSVPHLSPEFIGAMFSGEADAAVLALSRELVDEVLASDIIVLEAPMYNFGIPSVLKAWIDHVVRAGKTFQYGAKGPEGLLKGKKAFIIAGRGGIYSEGPYKVMDYQEPYLRAVLGFIGITEVETITVEGIAMGADAKEKALNHATERTHILAA